MTVATFATLMLVRPASFYPAVYRVIGERLFGNFGGDRVTHFEPIPGDDGLHDTRIAIGLRDGGGVVVASRLPVNSVREGYVPIAVVLALCAGLCSVRRPTVWSVLRAVAATETFVLLRVAIALVCGFSRVGIGDHHLLQIAPWVRVLVDFANDLLGTDIHGTYVIPAVIWALTCLRTSGLLADLAANQEPPRGLDWQSGAWVPRRTRRGLVRGSNR
ncbi:MAG TPA: hypothetical protein VFV19_13730 [Candidatus Polarisedimenticolaceae bacterium]|nr:hypothetical protein [Candidatus Polarisedimenticolaceae bacterium]